MRQFGKGEVEQFIRYYMIPGAGHGFGPFNARLECLPALENWVEKGQAPRQLTAIDANPNAHRSRPVCLWPAWPKFTGVPGTENDAAGFTRVTE